MAWLVLQQLRHCQTSLSCAQYADVEFNGLQTDDAFYVGLGRQRSEQMLTIHSGTLSVLYYKFRSIDLSE